MDSRRLRILLVDDDEDDYFLTRDLLSEIEDGELDLDWLATYEAAVEAIARRAHDLCLIDYHLGGRDGLELLREARRNHCMAPMILLTGQGDHHVDVEAMQAGAADYLVKGQLTAPLLERSIRYAVQQARQEAALRESEGRYRALVENAGDVIYTHDLEGHYTSINEAAERLMGYTREEALTKTVADLVVPGSLKLVDERNLEIFELEILTKDHRRVALEARVKLMLKNGNPVGWQGIARDITERKKAEDALRQSEEQRRALLEVANSIAGALDLPTLIDRVQRRTAELLHCDMVLTFAMDAETEVVQVVSEYGVPTHLLAPLHALRFSGTNTLGGRLRQGETVVIDDMAAQPWLSAELMAQFGITALIAAPVQMREHYFGAIAACHVTARRFEPRQIELFTGIARQLAVANDAAEQFEMQKQEAEVSGALARVGREIVTALGTPRFLDRLCQVTAEVLECDTSHTLLWRPEEDVYVPVAGYGATPEEQEIARILKVPRQMMSSLLAKLERADVSQVGTIPTDLLSSAEQQRLGLAANFCMALRRGTTLIGLQVALARGRTEPFRQVHWRIAQGIAQVASVALEHARVVEELNQASRLKSEFVATMSHELRTPLNIIMGYTDLLLGKEFGPLNLDQVDTLQRVDRSARELVELVSTTLDLSRFEAGQAPLVVQEIALADLVSEVRAQTWSVGEKPNVNVVWTVPELPRVCTDAMKLKTVLRNLLNNAIKFTERGTITVSAMPTNDGVVFSVADTGIGIAPENLPIIFEPFRQGDSSMTRQYGGVGLGLYIVRRFVDLLGATVAVETEVGKGSTFRVWVPLRAISDRVAA